LVTNAGHRGEGRGKEIRGGGKKPKEQNPPSHSK